MVNKRVFVFIDSQNLYHSIKRAFLHSGYGKVRFNEPALVNLVCENLRNAKEPESLWDSISIYYYMAMPSQLEDPRLYGFWMNKRKYLVDHGVIVRSSDLVYQSSDDAGVPHSRRVRKASGILVSLTADLVCFTSERRYDVAVIFSQNQHLQYATSRVKELLREQQRFASLYSVYPESYRTKGNYPGINGITWYTFGNDIYDACSHS